MLRRMEDFMKNLNIMLYISNMTSEINKAIGMIENSEDINKAKRFANRALGLIDAIIIMNNTMICTENNDITAQIDELTDKFRVDMWQAMCDIALKNGDDEAFMKYAKERDKYFN